MNKKIISFLDLSIQEEFERLVPFNKLITLLISINFNEDTTFNFNDRTHQVFFCEEEDGLPIEFFKSTELDGFDIYVWESVKDKGDDFLKVILAHELTEIITVRLFIIRNQEKFFLTDEQRHDIAVIYEQKFADILLGKDSKRREEYARFSKWIFQHSYLN